VRTRGGGTAVVGSLAVANGLGYLLNLVASRRLGPEGYGALAALLGVILVGNVLALALQAVVARRTVVARGPGSTSEVSDWTVRLSVGCAVVATAIGLVVAMPLTHLLHLGSTTPAILLGVSLGPLTLVGGQLGVLQGAERFHALAGLYLLAAVGKVGGGVAGVVVADSVTGAMVGTAVGAAVSAGAGAVLVRRVHPHHGAGGGFPSGLTRETARATYSIGALFALANLDVVLARHFLSPRQAGLYAIGAVLAKGAFWLTSFVPVMALPGLADPRRRRRTAALSLGTVVAAGALVTLGAAALGEPVVRLVGGAAYTSLADRAWLFAAVGSLLAIVQLLIYSRLAGEDRRVTLPWLVVVVEVAVVWLWRHDSITEIVTTALAAAAVVVALGALAEAHEHGMPWSRGGRRPARAATGDQARDRR
jgi:O-antigen/teichoic acid export membrane protein